MMYKAYLLTSATIIYLSYHTIYKGAYRNKLVYIQLEGFRNDYISPLPSNDLPGFSKLWQNGVRAHYMNSLFPSVTSTARTALATGLWAESHGIVGDFLYDAEEEQYFSIMGETRAGIEKWWTAEPIWITATKAKIKTGVLQWPICAIPFNDVLPSYCKSEKTKSLRDNLDTALDMLSEGYEFIQIYDTYVDDANRIFGPSSEERKKAVEDVDATMLYFMTALQDKGIMDQVNVILVSGHGSTSAKDDSIQRVELDEFLLKDEVEVVLGEGAFSNIKVKEGSVEEVYKELEDLPGVDVHLHEYIPEDLHVKRSKAIHDILVIAHNGTYILGSDSSVQIPPRDDETVYRGFSGYDTRENQNMRAIFLASGPDFKSGYEIPAIEIVDIYPLLTNLLQIDERPNNGTFENINTVLLNVITESHISVSKSTSTIEISKDSVIDTYDFISYDVYDYNLQNNIGNTVDYDFQDIQDPPMDTKPQNGNSFNGLDKTENDIYNYSAISNDTFPSSNTDTPVYLPENQFVDNSTVTSANNTSLQHFEEPIDMNQTLETSTIESNGAESPNSSPPNSTTQSTLPMNSTSISDHVDFDNHFEDSDDLNQHSTLNDSSSSMDNDIYHVETASENTNSSNESNGVFSYISQLFHGSSETEEIANSGPLVESGFILTFLYSAKIFIMG